MTSEGRKRRRREYKKRKKAKLGRTPQEGCQFPDGMTIADTDRWWEEERHRLGIDDESKRVFHLATWEMPDGQIIVRLGPLKTIILPGPRDDWWHPWYRRPRRQEEPQQEESHDPDQPGIH